MRRRRSPQPIYISVFPSGNHLVRFLVRVPGLADRSGVAGHGSDTGGEFVGCAAMPIDSSPGRLETTARTGFPSCFLREQTANREFATGVGSFDGQRTDRFGIA